jgi:hypothetical protein
VLGVRARGVGARPRPRDPDPGGARPGPPGGATGVGPAAVEERRGGRDWRLWVVAEPDGAPCPSRQLGSASRRPRTGLRFKLSLGARTGADPCARLDARMPPMPRMRPGAHQRGPLPAPPQSAIVGPPPSLRLRVATAATHGRACNAVHAEGISSQSLQDLKFSTGIKPRDGPDTPKVQVSLYRHWEPGPCIPDSEFSIPDS